MQLVSDSLGFTQLNNDITVALVHWVCKAGWQALQKLTREEQGLSALIHNLSKLNTTAGDFDRALQLSIHEVETKRSALGGTHLTTLKAIAYLGYCYWEKGDLDSSLPYTLEALNGLETRSGARTARHNWPCVISSAHT